MPKGSKGSKGSEASTEESAFNRPKKLSANLADIVGMKEAGPDECIKRLRAYLKANNLRDPENKQFFTPDKKLAKIFGNDRVEVFDMMKYIDNHLTKIDSTIALARSRLQASSSRAVQADQDQPKKEEFFIPSTVLAGPRSKKSKKN